MLDVRKTEREKYKTLQIVLKPIFRKISTEQSGGDIFSPPLKKEETRQKIGNFKATR